MSKKEAITRYNLIINKLRRQASTFDEISDYLALESEIQGYDFNISKRTFHRDKADILSIYNIDICFDNTTKSYYIDENHSEISHRILEAFDIFNALNISERLSRHIHFETRKPIGTEHLQELLNAIEHHRYIEIAYQKFFDEEPSKRRIEPYALKESKHRWYLLGVEENQKQIKIFALDRLTNLTTSRQKFKRDQQFDINSYFENSFGIIHSKKKKPQKIVLSFTPLQGKYIKTLPLHHSQKVIVDNNDELQVELTLNPTRDFIMELLSHGDDVRVIKPQHLVNEIKSTLEKTIAHYQ